MSEKTSIVVSNNLKPLSIANGENAAEKWKLWKQKFQILSDANDLDKQPETKQVAIFLNSIGDDGLEIFNSFNIDRKKVTLDEILKKLDEKFNPCKNTTVERYNFFTRHQKDGESLDEYVTILNNMAQTCQFQTLKESLVKDMFIIGIKNLEIKQKLLQQEVNSVEEALKISKSIELSHERSIKIQNTEKESVQFVKKEGSNNFRRQRSISRQRSSSRNSSRTRDNYQSSRKKTHIDSTPCRRCGQPYHRYKCPAQGKICSICKKPNHFANYCYFKDKYQKPKTVSNILDNNLEIQNETQNNCNFSQDFIIGTIGNEKSVKDFNQNWIIDINCYGHTLKCQIDTGADINVISKQTLDEIQSKTKQKIPLFQTNNRIFSFSGQKVENVGSCVLKCLFDNNLEANIYFVIVTCPCKTIIGWKTLEKYGIVKRIFTLTKNQENEVQTSPRFVQTLLQKYSDTFKGLGCLETKVHLDVDKTVQPKVSPVRRIPYALQKKLKHELDRMEKLNVIEKVTKPTTWVNAIVPVEKPNGSLRICLDPRPLNKAIKRPHYPFPTFDELRSQVQGSTTFSKLDANSGYWMLPLDEESSDLCTFNTPYGRYKFLRLPYGINSSGEIFHRIMTDLFHDLPGVICFVDDILVFSSNETEHKQHLENVFKRAKEANLKFNMSKCKFGLSEVSYVGHIFNKEGVLPDQQKIKAILDMPIPTNVKELQRFLGMINYLGSYIPNLSSENSILRDLLKKDNSWQWTSQHDEQVKKLKSLICESPTLVHYNVNKPIRMSVDASKDAVGAVIFHEKNPIAYASKALTSTQQNYAQIEKELFAIVFGCKKFHQYIYGKTTHVETDHQPLVTLFKKPLADVPMRLQRMMISIQCYDLIVSYTKGSQMYVSDTLSRAPINNTVVEKFDFNELDADINSQVNLLTSNLAITQEKLDKILSHTNSDLSLQQLKEYYKNGWPSCKTLCNPLVAQYWHIRDEIHVLNNLVFRNNSVIIPKSMRPEILSILHEGHQGIEKTKSLARGIVFWPNINNDIEIKIKQCESCIVFSSNKTKEPLLSHEQPNLPWQKVATDLFEYKSQKYLLVVDFYSNYIEIALLKNDSRSSTVITHLKSIFARHGIPLKLLSDGGPPYNSNEFKYFLKEWDIEHIVSSPYVPRSNGLAEASVKIIKNNLRKCEQAGTDPYIGLLQYRTSPRGNLKSPSELLMSRKLRTKLPTNVNNLKPKVVHFSEHMSNKEKRLQKSKSYYDMHAKNQPDFQVNDQIFFKKNPNDIHWNKGLIMSKTKFPRSYLVKDLNGSVYNRNSQHIKLFKSNLSMSSSQKWSQSQSQQSQSQNKELSYNNKKSQTESFSQKMLSSTQSVKQNCNLNNSNCQSFSNNQSHKIISKSKRKLSKNYENEDEDNCIIISYSIPKDNVQNSQENISPNSFVSVDSNQSQSDLDENYVYSPEFIEIEDNIEEIFMSEQPNNQVISQSSGMSESSSNMNNNLISDNNNVVIHNPQDLPESIDMSFSSNTPQARYSRTGRLLKKPKRLDL